MRCIITGGSGFIGSHLASALQKKMQDVLVLDMVKPTLENSVTYVAVDICDTARIQEIISDFRPNAIYHLAGVADARAAIADPSKAVQANITGTVNVLSAAYKSGVERVILASSSWVYNAMRYGVVDEQEPFLPQGGGHIYTSTMIAREFLAHDFLRLYGLHFTVLRYSPIYGPGMWPGLAVNAFIEAAQAGGPIIVFGNGEEVRPFLYIEDLVEAFLLSLQPKAADQVYNLQGLEAVTVNELAHIISDMFGGVEIVHRDESTRRGELNYPGRFISNEKALSELHWQPHVTLREGIAQVLAHKQLPGYM